MCKKLSIRAFCLGIICFCTSNGSVEIVKLISFQKKSQAFFNILTEPLLVQKQMILQQKALILSFLQMESLRAWLYQEGSTPTCSKKTFKKSKFNGAKSGRKK
jgi:hypothetical protein